jgi:hypothetical protein
MTARLTVVGSPAYFARRGTPTHPRELTEHDCLNWHPTPNSPPYRWEFTETGRDFSVAVPARVLSRGSAFNHLRGEAGEQHAYRLEPSREGIEHEAERFQRHSAQQRFVLTFAEHDRRRDTAAFQLEHAFADLTPQR